MLLKLQTWNGNAINDWNGSTGTFEAVIPPGANAMPGVTPEYADLGENYPLLTGISVGAASYTFVITLHGTIHSAIDTLNKYFRVDMSTSAQLVAYDTADSNRSWYVQGRVMQPPTQIDEARVSTFVIVLALDFPYWQESSLQTATWNITASGQTTAITPRGNLPTNPTYDIKPTSSKTGSYGYRRFYAVYNPGDTIFSLYPFSLTGTGLDTAALVTGSKMLASGNDYVCALDTSKPTCPRWFGGGGINSTTTRVFVNLSLKPRIELTISVSIANSSAVPATIQFASTDANKKAIKRLPKKGILLIDSELFYYTSVNVAALTVTPSERQSRGTSYAAHSVGATARWIQHDIWLMYGNSSASAPVIDDTYKPVLNLTSSHNTSWVWDSMFWDGAEIRSGRWMAGILRLADYADGDILYSGDHATYTDTGDASDPGLAFKANLYDGIPKATNAAAEVKLYHPAGVTHVTGNFEKYRSHTLWPTAAFQKSADGRNWTAVAALTTPGSASSWTAQALGSTALGATYRFVRMLLDGGTAAIIGAMNAIEMNDFTVTLDSAKVPQIVTGAELAGYYLAASFANNANSYSLDVFCVQGTSVSTVIDTENLTATAPTGEGIPVYLSSPRPNWLPLEGGVSNTLTFTELVGATSGNLTVTITYRGRNSL